MPKHQGKFFWTGFLTAVFLFTVIGVVGCGGERVDDDNRNPDGAVDGQADGGVDAQVSQDAWTFECPAEQPDGYVCIRGQVRDIITDEPVEVPGGGVVERYVAEQEGGFPNKLDSVAVLAEDGRFIFSSAREALVTDDKCDPFQGRCDHYIYDQFDLRLSADLPGLIIPDNKYGIKRHSHLLKYYVVSEQDGATWETNWPTNHDSNTLCTDGDTLNLGAYYKTVLGVCYDVSWDDPPVAYPEAGVMPFLVTYDGLQKHCTYPLLQDRITFDDMSDPDHYANYPGFGVMILDESPSSSDDIVHMRCFHLVEHVHSHIFPTYGMIGPEDIDETGRVVVVHSLLW